MKGNVSGCFFSEHSVLSVIFTAHVITDCLLSVGRRTADKFSEHYSVHSYSRTLVCCMGDTGGASSERVGTPNPPAVPAIIQNSVWSV